MPRGTVRGVDTTLQWSTNAPFGKIDKVTLQGKKNEGVNVIFMQRAHFNFAVMEGGLQNRDDKTMMCGIPEPCSTCCNREGWKCLEHLPRLGTDQPTTHPRCRHPTARLVARTTGHSSSPASNC